MKSKIKLFILTLTSLSFLACKSKEQQPILSEPQEVTKVVERPEFSSDSAFYYIYKQVEFGYRVPGSEAHEQCATWLSNVLKDMGAEVQVQETKLLTAENKTVPCYNIIGSYLPDAKVRILLAAHWDTRPWADQDNEHVDQPILGANDGASGVGILLEIARQIKKHGTEVGIDIVFFDVEDSGLNTSADSYCLGSQYWARNPHVPNYYAYKGILLDMVGSEDAVFTMEGTSMMFNPDLVNEVWNIAHQLGHDRFFSYKKTPAIIDDHVYVNKYLKIPMIDIIHNDPTTVSGFGRYWHTHNDNMNIISKTTLQAVGETVLATIKNK